MSAPLLPFLYAAEGQFKDRYVLQLASILEKYRLEEALRCVSGLLMVPRLQANCYRLELLVHLIVASCRGNAPVKKKHVGNWLNRQLAREHIAGLEDPIEDVFVSNVITSNGDYLVLGGMWEVPDAATSLLIDVFERHAGHPEWLEPVHALLAISDLVLRRAGLSRWDIEASTPKKEIQLPGSDATWDEYCGRTALSVDDLASSGINIGALGPFMFSMDEAPSLLSQSNQESDLHARPLIRINETIYVALPTSTTYAARRYLIRQAAAAGWLPQLQSFLMGHVEMQTMRLLLRSSRHEVEAVELPPALVRGEALCKSNVIQVGQRRFIHAVFLPDSLSQFAAEGLLNPTTFSDDAAMVINGHIESVRDHVEKAYTVDFGHTLVVVGHLGQAFTLPLPKQRERWTVDSCRLHNLKTILQQSKAPLNKLILLLETQETMRAEGVRIPTVNGLINLYAYWREQGYNLRALDAPRSQRAVLYLATDHVTGFRLTRRRAIDAHCAPSVFGGAEEVVHANSDSIYESQRALPTYISVSRMSRGRPSFCIPLDGTVVWITVRRVEGDEWLRHVGFTLWEGLQLLATRFLLSSGRDIRFPKTAVEVLLDFSGLVEANEARDHPELLDEIELFRHQSKSIVKLVAGPALLRRFTGLNNHGERYLLQFFVAACRMLGANDQWSMEECEEDARLALRNEDAKLLHAFESDMPVERLLSTHANPVYKRPSEHVAASMHDAFSWHPAKNKRIVLTPKDSCAALNEAVSHAVRRVTLLVKRFDRRLIIERVMFLHETLLRDKQQWRSTARAVHALHGEYGASAAERIERERTESSVTFRSIIEASLCECPLSGGISPDEYSIDRIYGIMCSVIVLGRDSETIHRGLASKGITIHPNGEYSFRADVLDAIGSDYAIASFSSTFNAAAADYDRWVVARDKPEAPIEKGEFGTTEFRKAFLAEYGFSFPVFIEIVGVLLDCGVEREQVVVSLAESELAGQCARRQISRDDLAAFLKAFSLQARRTWTPELPVTPSDVEPWRYERRLSVMLRPLIDVGAPAEPLYVYGVGTLREAFGYILDSTTRGLFDKDVFTSREMRSYIGGQVDAAGRDFTRSVAERMRTLGWHAEPEVKMSRLGAGKQPNLGDIDVLAWKDDGEVLAIECKRLKGARTISEIARTCFRFAGNEGDHLHKHLRRLKWLTDNPEKLAAFIKVEAKRVRVEGPLVTSVVVPFAYVKNLPIKSENIVPIERLDEFIAKRAE